MEYTDDQRRAIDAITQHWNNRGELLTLGGYAGTGKTTVVSESIKHVGKERKPTAYCAYTGKASSVLGRKLRERNALGSADYCGTIHALIYVPILDDRGEVEDWELNPSLDYERIVIDEASMVTAEIFDDLRSFGIPILAVGDHGQLPPVGGSFHLMDDPQITLTTICRQDADNPIIRLASMARNGERIPVKNYGPGIFRTADKNILDKVKDFSECMVICGYNKSRHTKNQIIRKRLGFTDPEPMIGDKVICLQNNRKAGIYNGMIGKILKIRESGKFQYETTVEMDNGESMETDRLCLPMMRSMFGSSTKPEDYQRWMGELFDFGYALTVWKAQGSEAKNVVFFPERMPMATDDDYNRFLYTGITRAQQKLIIAGR